MGGGAYNTRFGLGKWNGTLGILYGAFWSLCQATKTCYIFELLRLECDRVAFLSDLQILDSRLFLLQLRVISPDSFGVLPAPVTLKIFANVGPLLDSVI